MTLFLNGISLNFSNEGELKLNAFLSFPQNQFGVQLHFPNILSPEN